MASASSLPPTESFVIRQRGTRVHQKALALGDSSQLRHYHLEEQRRTAVPQGAQADECHPEERMPLVEQGESQGAQADECHPKERMPLGEQGESQDAHSTKPAAASPVQPDGYVLKEKYLQNAIHFYMKAIEVAKMYSDCASAHKNCATALQDLRMLRGSRDHEEVLEDFRNMIYHWSRALAYGNHARFDETWKSKLLAKYTETLEQALVIIEMCGTRTAVTWIEKTMNVMVEQVFKLTCILVMLDRILSLAEEESDKQNFGVALGLIQETENLILEAESISSSETSALKYIKERIKTIKIQATAMQIIKKADDVLAEIKSNDGDLNQTALYEVIDWYTKAVIMSENIDPDTAAEGYHRLGDLYRSVLHNEDRAKSYFKKSWMQAELTRERADEADAGHTTGMFPAIDHTPLVTRQQPGYTVRHYPETIDHPTQTPERQDIHTESHRTQQKSTSNTSHSQSSQPTHQIAERADKTKKQKLTKQEDKLNESNSPKSKLSGVKGKANGEKQTSRNSRSRESMETLTPAQVESKCKQIREKSKQTEDDCEFLKYIYLKYNLADLPNLVDLFGRRIDTLQIIENVLDVFVGHSRTHPSMLTVPRKICDTICNVLHTRKEAQEQNILNATLTDIKSKSEEIKNDAEFLYYLETTYPVEGLEEQQNANIISTMEATVKAYEKAMHYLHNTYNSNQYLIYNKIVSVTGSRLSRTKQQLANVKSTCQIIQSTSESMKEDNSFLQYIYKTHPVGGCDAKNIKDRDIMKEMQAAVSAYTQVSEGNSDDIQRSVFTKICDTLESRIVARTCRDIKDMSTVLHDGDESFLEWLRTTFPHHKIISQNVNEALELYESHLAHESDSDNPIYKTIRDVLKTRISDELGREQLRHQQLCVQHSIEDMEDVRRQYEVDHDVCKLYRSLYRMYPPRHRSKRMFSVEAVMSMSDEDLSNNFTEVLDWDLQALLLWSAAGTLAPECECNNENYVTICASM